MGWSGFWALGGYGFLSGWASGLVWFLVWLLVLSGFWFGLTSGRICYGLVWLLSGEAYLVWLVVWSGFWFGLWSDLACYLVWLLIRYCLVYGLGS